MLLFQMKKVCMKLQKLGNVDPESLKKKRNQFRSNLLSVSWPQPLPPMVQQGRWVDLWSP